MQDHGWIIKLSKLNRLRRSLVITLVINMMPKNKHLQKNYLERCGKYMGITDDDLIWLRERLKKDST